MTGLELLQALLANPEEHYLADELEVYLQPRPNGDLGIIIIRNGRVDALTLPQADYVTEASQQMTPEQAMSYLLSNIGKSVVYERGAGPANPGSGNNPEHEFKIDLDGSGNLALLEDASNNEVFRVVTGLPQGKYFIKRG